MRHANANMYFNARAQLEVRTAVAAAWIAPDVPFMLAMGAGPLQPRIRAVSMMMPSLLFLSRPRPRTREEAVSLGPDFRYTRELQIPSMQDRFQQVFRNLPRPSREGVARYVHGLIQLDLTGDPDFAATDDDEHTFRMHTNSFIYDRVARELLYIEPHELTPLQRVAGARRQIFEQLQSVLNASGANIGVARLAFNARGIGF